MTSPAHPTRRLRRRFLPTLTAAVLTAGAAAGASAQAGGTEQPRDPAPMAAARAATAPGVAVMPWNTPNNPRFAEDPRIVAAARINAANVTGPRAAAARQAGPGAQAAPAENRPNFLYINLDDARHEDFKHMPFVAKIIGDQGVTATNLVAPTPICVPSRASALTGKTAYNHGMLTVDGPRGTADAFNRSGANTSTIATWLNKAGYDTFMTGKWMNGYERELPPGFTEPGWDKWNPSTVGTYHFHNTRFYNGRGTEGDNRYNTYQITDRSVNWIRAHENDPDPWFAWVNYVGPHSGGPNEADDPDKVKTTARAAEDRGTFANITLPQTPDMWRAAPGSFGDTKVDPAVRAAARKIHQQRVEAMQSIDRGVQRQVAFLRRTKQLGETYIIVTSDNGYEVGEHNHLGKLLPYYGSRSVPFVMRGPGLPRNRVVKSDFMVPDIPVTIAALAGAEPKTGSVDGMNVFSLLRGKTTGARPIPIAGWGLGNGDPNDPFYTGLIYGDWVLVEKKKGYELYNRKDDPYELKNLAGVPEVRKDAKALRTMEAQLRECSGNQCVKEYGKPTV